MTDFYMFLWYCTARQLFKKHRMLYFVFGQCPFLVILCFWTVSVFGKPVGETRQNPYPRLEGTGFVRVRKWLPGPVPRRECEGFSNPHGLQARVDTGTGTGLHITTLRKPAPVVRVVRVLPVMVCI